jgi:hypothetical protein
LPIFRERCEARAILVEACAMDLADAVDGLQDAAAAYGLVEAMGQDTVQEIMAEAFGPVKPDGGGFLQGETRDMTPHLTTPDPELNRLVKRTPPGMMYWSGTCTDLKATCGACHHFGYSVVVRNDAGNAINTSKYPDRCALAHSYTKKHGERLPQDTPACKYFEHKQP